MVWCLDPGDGDGEHTPGTTETTGMDKEAASAPLAPNYTEVLANMKTIHGTKNDSTRYYQL